MPAAPADLRDLLRLPYRRDTWAGPHGLLRQLFPQTDVFTAPHAVDCSGDVARRLLQLGAVTLADGKRLGVFEVELASTSTQIVRNRVGLRELARRLIDEATIHGALAFYFHPEVGEYRFSFISRQSRLDADGSVSASETHPKRFTYVLGPGEMCRTAAERFDRLRAAGAAAKIDDLVEAFKVAPLFKEFYREYGEVFAQVETLIRPSMGDPEALRLFAQRLFNRLLFIVFLQRKGWLRFGGRTDYLTALWDDYHRKKPASSLPPNFYVERLQLLFFSALNNSDERNIIGINRGGFLGILVGQVPYLNGGLFEKDAADEPAGLLVPDEAIAAILDPQSGLFSRYNFTVAESTPLEIEVAVDPEMLGKVFEELVTGRHEQGSYYTPKPIVSFMGRAALEEYLADRCPHESRAALESFVHDHQPGSLRDAETVLAALRSVTICDPACGSGAYLLGMLHELLDLRTVLFNAVQKLDAPTAHERKLEIIERNLYGVDLDPFAVNIARLRLWLSLAVEFEGQTPPPLPNLDFKIERGDALAGPAPATLLNETSALRDQVITEFRMKKAAFLRAHDEEKRILRAEIDRLRGDLRTWLHSDAPADAFDWAIEFAEVFLPTPAPASISGGLNLGDELAAPAALGGFDIVVANPPYVRMELIKPQKPVLRRRFPYVHAERADLYIYFYARAHELLRPGGVAAFISSNKWLRAGYGEALRRHLLDDQAFRLVMDFGELPVFESAATDAAVFLWQKQPRADAVTRWAMVKDLDRCYAGGVRDHFRSLCVEVPAAQFGAGKPRLATAAAADLRARMERSGLRLVEVLRGQVCRGVVTGLNEAFVIDQSTRDRLIAETPAAEEIIKPLLAGNDVRRYELHYRHSFLIYTFHGVDIRRYPSVEKHLRPFRSFKNDKGETVGLEHRATEQEWYELQQPQMAYREWFDGTKLVYPEIGKEARFVMEDDGRHLNNKCFFLPSSDYFLLGVLNSASVFDYLKEVCALLGDKDAGGRLEYRAQYLETLPIPDAPAAERTAVGRLAEQTQALHGKRRARVERFLRDLGLDPAQSNSRNPLETPWAIGEAEFGKRAKLQPVALFRAARDETAALTEETAKLEAEIDARVAALYGLGSLESVCIIEGRE